MMRNVSHWTLGGRGDSDRRLRLRCGSQLSHNLKLSPNERRETLLLLLRFAKGGTARMFRCSCGLHARGTREEATKREGARIVKAASHKHPHNDLCDERSFGDSFFVLLRPIFLSLRTMRTCIYFLRLPPLPPLYLSFSFSFHVMQSLFPSPFILHTLCPCTSSLRHLSLSLFLHHPSRVHHLSFSHASSFPFLFSPPRNSSRYIFFSGKVCRNTPRPAGELVLIFD